jgi:hypothetical protein
MNVICFVENKSTNITQTNLHNEGVIKIPYHVYIIAYQSSLIADRHECVLVHIFFVDIILRLPLGEFAQTGSLNFAWEVTRTVELKMTSVDRLLF